MRKVIYYRKVLLLILTIGFTLSGCNIVKNDTVTTEQIEPTQPTIEAVDEVLTMDKLMEMCNKTTWDEDVTKQGLSMFTQYANVIESEIGNEESLTNLYTCKLSYDSSTYELQIYYWLPKTAKEYGYEENEIDAISIYHTDTKDGQLLYMTPKEEGFTPNTDILSFLSKIYDLKEYITYEIPKGETLRAYQVDAIDPFDGYLFEGVVTELPNESVPRAWIATGGIGMCSNEEINFLFEGEKISGVEGIQRNHMEIRTDGKSFSTSDFSVYMVEIEFELFTAADKNSYELENNVKLTDKETLSRYYYAYLGTKESENKYVAFLNADQYSEEEMIQFVNRIKIP